MATHPVGKLNFRISPEAELRLRAAADAAHQTLTEFVLGAAHTRADEILATGTAVPSDYFDRLLAALDEPAVAIPQLVKVARRRRQFARH